MRRGRPIFRQDCETIAERRRVVAALFARGLGPKAILQTLRQQAPALVDGLVDPYNTLLDDLRLLRRKQAADLTRELVALMGHEIGEDDR